ncbi:MAG: hypothetical protein LUC92_00485 [Clostridiales bacterium]|nr:hypothetical protein [Clostridiales bacterium]
MYSLAKVTNINKSSLHMVLHFKRKMQPRHFYAIIENLPLSLAQKRDLTERFQKITMGDNKYNADKYILDMLKELSDYTFFSASPQFFTPTPSS